MTGSRVWVWVALALALVLVTGLAGCPGAEPGPGSSVTFSGEFNVSDEGFVMDGQIVEEPGAAGLHEFHDVAVYLYTEDGTLIANEPVGTLDVRANVSITSEQVPQYVVLDSPEFWETETLDVSYYERTRNDLYAVRDATTENELPVVPEREGRLRTSRPQVVRHMPSASRSSAL